MMLMMLELSAAYWFRDFIKCLMGFQDFVSIEEDCNKELLSWVGGLEKRSELPWFADDRVRQSRGVNTGGKFTGSHFMLKLGKFK